LAETNIDGGRGQRGLGSQKRAQEGNEIVSLIWLKDIARPEFELHPLAKVTT
jgi:hypothetical protein